MAQGYDLSALKRIDSFDNFEVQARTIILFVVAVSATIILDDLIWVWWFLAYLVAFSVYSYSVRRAPRWVSGTYLALVAVLGFFTMMAILSAGLYLFANVDVFVRYGGLILYFGAAMNTVALRVREPSFFVFDVAALYVAGLGFVVIEYLRSGLGQPILMLSLGMISFCLYLTVLVQVMDKLRQRLEAARNSQIAAEHQRAIGQISAGVAHDFNNLLTVVLGNLELSREMTNPGERQQLLAEAEAAARRGATLTGQLLAFSRKANLSPRVVNYAEIIEQLEPLAVGMLGRTHRLHVGDTAPMPPLLIDSATLIAVLLNLILNAKEAMPHGGTIWLDAEMQDKGDMPMMCLRINDTGKGMTAQVLDKIFEPFFSTKPAGQGSGLGLPMAQGFVEQSGGQIFIQSRQGQGSEVMLCLPVTDPPTSDASAI